MDQLKEFLMWCTLINGALLIFWSAWCVLLPDTVYRLQSRWLPISRPHYDVAMYAFLGLFKIVFIVFNLAPLIALHLMA